VLGQRGFGPGWFYAGSSVIGGHRPCQPIGARRVATEPLPCEPTHQQKSAFIKTPKSISHAGKIAGK
jgi:hypothetical protein